MSSSTASERITRRESVGSWRLWFGVLGAPVAWMLQLIIDYSLDEWFACSPGTATRGQILGFSSSSVAVIVSAVLGAVALVAGIVAFSCYRALTGTDVDDGTRRARWLALAGVFNSVLYLLIIVTSFAPPLLLSTCETLP